MSTEISCELFQNDSKGREFTRAVDDLIYSNYGAYGEIKFLLYDESLSSNIYSGSTFKIPLPDGTTLVVNNGCKTSKVLGKIAAAFDLPGYEEFRIAHSMILNQKTLKGNLCISIHPLDYMTMSYNDCGWTSCMDWTEGGEYRRGTIEMMNSECVIVAYLTAKEPLRWEDYEWSNKKWRQLFIVTPDVICGVKGYPYCNENLEKIVADWLRELSFWDYSDEYISFRQDSMNTLPNGNEVHISFSTDAMYNDFGSCSHHGYFGKNVSDNIWQSYSGLSECMCCGGCKDFDDERALVCNNCEELYRCYDCGDRFDASEMHLVDDEWLCDYCFSEAASECCLTNEVHLNYNLVDVSLERPDGMIMIDEVITISNDFIDLDYYCDEYTKTLYKKYFTAPIERLHRLWRGNIYYINAQNCTPAGLKLFGFNSMEDVEECDTYLISKDED
jgi:hypothetical protein